MEELLSLIITWQFLLVAAACGFIGILIKKIPGIPDWLIPFINLVFAVLVFMALVGFEVLNGLVGVLAAAVATYVYELFMQIFEVLVPKKEE